MLKPLHFCKKISVRTKLLCGYSLIFLLTMAISSLVLYFIARQTIETNIESELNNSTLSILNMVKTSVNTSIRNHLGGVASANLESVAYLYDLSMSGQLPEDEAKEKARKLLLSQRIGKTGYIYCIDSEGIIRVHPQKSLQEADLSSFGFIQKQKITKQGYIEYEWANPGETIKRDKALYMTYFEPWDWIISVSAYRDEIKHVFNVEDFQASILSLTFGETGYPYVMDSKGNLIIHPKLQGTNIYDSKDSTGRLFIQEICEQKNGKIIYPWKNPDEKAPRKKLVVFNYIEELDWIVASSSYLNEFYGPLKTINYALLLTVFIALIMFTCITLVISSSISTPLNELTENLASGVKGDLSGRMDMDWGGEIGYLACYFNSFMDNTQKFRDELLESEEKYRGIFEHAVGGIFQIDLEGKVLNINPSMARLLGYESPKKLIQEVENVFQELFVHPEHREKLLNILAEYGTVERFETRLFKKDRRIIWVSLNARSLKDDQDEFTSFEGFLMDVTERKTAEEILKQSREELEHRVEMRTNELSGKIKELEQRNLEICILHEMGEMIQVCRDSAETYPIISNYLAKFFPADSGAIFLFNDQTIHTKPIVTWGDYNKNEIKFTQYDCWALRHGKPYMVGNSVEKIKCAHVSKDSANGYLCIPMIVQGEINGLFHIEFEPTDAESTMNTSRLERKRDLAITISEQLTLAIANLNLRESLRIQSVQDPLTGLYNRRHMEKYLERESHRAKRHGTTVGVIMLDIDHFKNFNDTFGHDAGDAILKKFGTYLNEHVRMEDMACRYGGEEFTVIMVDTTVDDIAKKVKKICRDVQDLLVIKHEGKELKITVSAGAAAFPVHNSDIKTVIAIADAALYQAKREGRNKTVMVPVKEQVRDAVQTESQT